jgi:acetylglutamate kinase
LSEDYFDAVQPSRVYVSEHYRAAIVLLEDGVTYMDKLAVAEDAQGEGLGRAMWQTMRAETPQLMWRSRTGNVVNDFYFDQSDGALKDSEWTVFWCGMPDLAVVGPAADKARDRAPTILR